MGEAMVVGADTMIPYVPATPSIPPHERRTQGDRRLPGGLARREVERGPSSRGRVAVQASVTVMAITLSVAAFAMMVSHIVG